MSPPLEIPSRIRHNMSKHLFGGHPVRNTLFYGDNLEILRKHVPDARVDLVYLDPPHSLLAGGSFDFPSQSVLKGSKQAPSAKLDAGQGSLEM